MIDRQKAEKAASDLLTALGEDVNNPSIVDTPARVARMFEELLCGRNQDAADHLSQVFPLENPGLVIERDIPFYSLCEHHLLPFMGKVHIAYLPRKEVTGLSKLARTVDVYARRLQLQERMTNQICYSRKSSYRRCTGCGRSGALLHEYAWCEKTGRNHYYRCSLRCV